MKPILKLSGTLLLNQFLANIACAMCVIPFPMVFGGDSVFTYSLYTALMLFFFYYISYYGAYRVGFHDVGRHSSTEYDKGYLGRGILAAVLGAAPSIIMFIIWKVGKSFGIIALQTLQFPLFLWNMFGYWPISHIIPNHMTATFLICIIVQIVFPLVGYISGYKGIDYSLRIKEAILKSTKHK